MSSASITRTVTHPPASLILWSAVPSRPVAAPSGAQEAGRGRPDESSVAAPALPLLLAVASFFVEKESWAVTVKLLSVAPDIL